jgi:hypothetical protein
MKKPPDADDAPSLPAMARSVPARGEVFVEDWAADILRSIIQWQIEQIQMKPSTHAATTNRRAREARTMSELVNTLTKLDAVQKRREGKARKAKPRDDTAIRDEFIRRLDQLLAATGKGAIPGKPEPE